MHAIIINKTPFSYYINVRHLLRSAGNSIVQKVSWKKQSMSRGESFGGGKSSLSYLFESDEGTTSFEGSPKSTGQQKPPSDEDSKTKATDQSAAPNKPVSTNNYYRARGQNSGNFITVSSIYNLHSC